jgi:hypothetical protein
MMVLLFSVIPQSGYAQSGPSKSRLVQSQSPSQAGSPPHSSNSKKSAISDQTPLLRKFSAVKPVLLKGYYLPAEYLSAYYARRIEPKLDRPDYSSVANPQVLYRGMYITPDQLEFILEYGMAVNQVKWTAAGGGISFSSNANEAASYIFQSGNDRFSGVGVVFKVRMSPAMQPVNDPVLNRTRTIYKKQSNVMANEIVDVYLWGQYGLESLDEILRKISQNRITPHTAWTGQFSQSFSR